MKLEKKLHTYINGKFVNGVNIKMSINKRAEMIIRKNYGYKPSRKQAFKRAKYEIKNDIPWGLIKKLPVGDAQSAVVRSIFS